MKEFCTLSELAKARLSSQQRLMLGVISTGLEVDGSSTLLATGSIVTEEVDEYSDLDLIVVSESPLICEAAVRAVIAANGDLISCFTTNHLEAHQSSIYYVGIDQSVVKLDIVYVDASGPFDIPAGAKIVSGNVRTLDRAGSRASVESLESVLSLSATKLAAWLWFSYARAARGEFFAAARSIDFSRENALLPLMLYRLHLPQDGHRKLERRLPRTMLQELMMTYPSELNFNSIFDALAALRAIFLKELALSTLPCRNAISESAEKIWGLVLVDKQQSRP